MIALRLKFRKCEFSWGDENFVGMWLRRESFESYGSETVFSTMYAEILHNFSYWRAAPPVLRDAQVAVTPVQLEFSIWHAAPDHPAQRATSRDSSWCYCFNCAPHQTMLRNAQVPEENSVASQ
ncbi:hypothetical protein A2U01_0040852 [Trifolium medium]|uniref:Uncharacterized protein n=1 Tax=Trifolium medium TaxID=97028 RepID=A0A392Q712_9FABA|nr:hypothetical protein [Trifolium medium]